MNLKNSTSSTDSTAKSRLVVKIGAECFSENSLFQKLQTHRLLPHLYREIIVDQEISRLEISPDEINLGRQVIYRIHGISEEENRQIWRQKQGISLESFEQWSQRQIQIEIFKRRQWGTEISSLFLKRKESFDRAIYSLIRHTERAVILELFFRIQAQEDTIANLALQYSQGSEQQTHGLIGPIELGRVHPRIVQQLRVAKPGHVNAPLQLEDWFVIIQLEKWLPAQYDFTVEQRLLDELFQKWLEQQLKGVELQEKF
jgi:parvulin-like peptidyl-prolyl isomerase